MQIKKKIVDNGTIVGYMLEDGNFELPMCKKALYLEMYMSPLIQAGYKYYSYEADQIEDPTGTPISEHESMSRDDVDELEWGASIDIASTSALSDVEASKYYTFREESAYQFKVEPVYQINTREEFVAYLETMERTFYDVNYVADNRPINFFVNPEALFTIDELAANPDYKKYFDIMIKRHRLRNYGSYVQLVDWLVSKGVLNTKTPTTAEFLAAYYAWGPEGFKDKCTKVETKLNVDGMFKFSRDPLGSASSMSYVFDNRDKKMVIVDAQNNLHYLKTHENFTDITDVVEFKRSRILIPTNDELLQIRRRRDTGKKYSPVTNALYSDVSDRLYITLVSESGYTYTYKVAHNKVNLGLTHSNTNGAVYYSASNFAFASIFPGIAFPVDIIASADDYYIWNFAVLKAIQLIASKSEKAPVESTAEYLRNDGLNPVAIIDMISNSITRNASYSVNKRYALDNKADDLCDAFELYLQDIPEYILNAFDLSIEDLDNGIESFLELADIDDLRDRREQMMRKEIEPGQPGFDSTFTDYFAKYSKDQAMLSQVSQLMGRTNKKYDAADYYTKLLFVHDCLYGNISIDAFGDGIMDDLRVSYIPIVECIISTVYAEYGSNVTLSQAEELIANIESSDLIDIKSIITTRDNAYNGYLVDFAKYRENRASANTWAWAYCTKVFREISNAPIEKQRPYLMELVVVDNGKNDMKIRRLMHAVVKDAVAAAEFSAKPLSNFGEISNWSEKRCAEASIDYVAAQLFFFIYAGGVRTEPIDGNYQVTVNMYDSRNLIIKVPVDVYNFVRSFNKDTHKKYMTVYDYCKYEYNPNTVTGTFIICAVNVNVDPWHVKPKKGYSVKTYPLLPNYYEQNALDKANGAGFYQNAYDSHAICVNPLKLSYRDNFLPSSDIDEILMYEELVRGYSDVEDLYPYLDRSEHEYIFAYVRRWALERKKANAMGKKLISIPLKQDIVYSPLAYSYCEEAPITEPVYSNDTTVDDRKCQNAIDVANVSWKNFLNSNLAIETKQVSLKEVSTSNITLEEFQKLRDIIREVQPNNIPIIVTGNYINVKGDTLFRIAVSRLTLQQIMEFANNGILTKIGEKKYFIRAINGDFILEV